MISDRLLHRVQAATGALFALFLSLHLATTVAATGGPAAYDGTLGALRRIYRPSLAVEVPLILAPALIHLACALIQILRRRRRGGGARPGLRVRLHRWSGYYLLIAFAGHVLATRFAPLAGEGPLATGKADFAFLAFSLLSYPGVFIPYYVGLGLAGALHLSLGLPLAARILFPHRAGAGRPSWAGIAVAGAIALAVTVGVGSLIGRRAEADRARFAEYRGIYHRFVPFVPLPEPK